jgi:type II secretory pathway pseudopilin PulG
MNDRGFVRAFVMEGMIGIAILGIIAAIVIPQYVNYRNRDLNREAKAHAYQAYQASQAFFRVNPKAQATPEDISQFGYRSSPDIVLTIAGDRENLRIKAMHVRSNKAYLMDAKGELSTD